MIQPLSTHSHTDIVDDALLIFGTEANDTMQGGPHSEIILGEAGDDVLYGEQGDDDLIGGMGNDLLYGQDGNDVLAGGPGIDVLSGGAGQNLLRGGADGDLYLVGGLRSHDVIDNAAAATLGDTDMILFDKAVSPEQVFLRREEHDLMIMIPHMQSSVRVLGYFSDDGGTLHAVSGLRFENGTYWNVDAVKAMMLRGSSADDHLIGYASVDRIKGNGGNDVIEGRGGRDILSGGAGEDVLDGGDDDDFLNGGRGNDRLIGGAGSDLYFFERGFGRDLILSDGNTLGDADGVYLMDKNIDESQIWFQRVGDDLAISVIGTRDSLSINDWFVGASAGFACIELDSGKSIVPDKVDALVAAMAAMAMPSSTSGLRVTQHCQLGALIASSWVEEQGAA